jgi:hypothetical protein|tara:strand:+ start:462 stop:1184 length:723 start_codon:yes stop_codon:yes gene_type:complete
LIGEPPARLQSSFRDILDGVRTGHVVISGQTRYGKSTGALFLFNSRIFDRRSYACHIFVDTKHDDDLLGHGVKCDNIVTLAYMIESRVDRIIYRPPGTRDRKNHLTDIVNILFRTRERPEFKNANFALFVDEVQLYAKKQESHEGLERLSTTGAGKGIHAVVMAQRLQDIHAQMLSQCNTRISFFMQERDDYLRSQNMLQLADWMEWLKKNPYYFAYQTLADWQLHTPFPYGEDLSTLLG